MKKIINTAMFYMIYGLIAGVFHILMAVAFYFFFKSLKSIAE